MSAPLPDDLNGWPLDPFRLLGVDRKSDAKTARRAYVRLIRRFKPEHHPEHFKRIRQAYESVEQQLRWQTYEAPPDFDAPPPEQPPQPDADSRDAEAAKPAEPDAADDRLNPPPATAEAANTKSSSGDSNAPEIDAGPAIRGKPDGGRMGRRRL